MGKITKQQQALLLAVVAVVFGAYGYWHYLLKPTLEQINQKESAYKDLLQKIETAEGKSRRLPALKNELEKLQVELLSMEKQLPTDKDIPGILRILTREALTENLNFVSLRPVDPKRDGFFDVLEFEISMTGSLHTFIRFMSSLGQQDRIFQFGRLSLTGGGPVPEGQSSVPLGISFVIKTYAYVG